MKVNDKVVCVFDSWHPWVMADWVTFVGPLPVKGRVYTIEKVIPCNDGTVGLRLTGHTSFNSRHLGEVGYSVCCFRKLEDVKKEAELSTQEPMPVLRIS